VAERVGYRHGSKSRRLTLRTGTVQLEVPRARLAEADGREREWQSQLVPRYRRSSREVEQSVLGVYLVALGVRENGEKVLLSLMTTGAESADGWQLLLDDLTVRKMGRPRLMISDGNAGLVAALDRRWPGLPQQRCTVLERKSCCLKKEFHDFTGKKRYSLFYRFRDITDPTTEEIDLDMDGDKSVPEQGSFIQRRGKPWQVVRVNVRTMTNTQSEKVP
jgi:hypothetical protein